MDPQTAKLMPIIVPLLLVAFILRRNLQPRPLQIDRLWLYPVILLLAIGSALYESPPTTMIGVASLAAGLGLGVLAGWYRGRLTRITIDPETHAMTSQASIWGTVLIGGLIAVRYGLRLYLMPDAMSGAHTKLGDTATIVTDALLAFTVGMMCTARLEMWLRARKLLAEAQAAKGMR